LKSRSTEKIPTTEQNDIADKPLIGVFFSRFYNPTAGFRVDERNKSSTCHPGQYYINEQKLFKRANLGVFKGVGFPEESEDSTPTRKLQRIFVEAHGQISAIHRLVGEHIRSLCSTIRLFITENSSKDANRRFNEMSI
jgi:hypothetical protein